MMRLFSQSEIRRTDMRISAVMGGCGGLGSAIVSRLLEAGDRVYLLDIEASRGDAEVLVRAAPAGRAVFVSCDLTDAESVRRAFATIASGGRLEAFIHAAGIIRRGAFVDVSAEDLDAMTAVNITGSFLALQAAARLMIAGGGGHIVSVASVHGLRTTAGRAAYAMSKGAILALTRALATELAVHGILVNAVAPGPVAAGMQHSESEARRLWTAATPLGRVANAGEVADAAVFLASPANTFITGDTLIIDGGASAAITG